MLVSSFCAAHTCCQPLRPRVDTLNVRSVDQPVAGQRRGVRIVVARPTLDVGGVRQTGDGLAHSFVAQAARSESLAARRVGGQEGKKEVLRADPGVAEVPGLLCSSRHEVKRGHRS